MTDGPTQPRSWRGRNRAFWSAVIFSLLAFCYLATAPPTFSRAPSDCSPTSLVAVALVQHGDCDLTRYDALLQPRELGSVVIRSQERLVSFYPIGAAVSALPFYVPYFALRRAPVSLSDAEHAGQIAAIFFAAASAVLLLWVLWEWTTPGRAFLLCLLYGLGTCNLSVLNKALWQHTPAEFWIAAGMYALSGARLYRVRWLAAAGACLGMAVFCRPSNLPYLLAPMLWILLERRFKACALVALGAGIPAALNVAYNLTYLGSVVGAGGYASGLIDHAPNGERIWGMLASPGRGLFVFVPFLLLLPAALWNLRTQGREQGRLVASMVLAFGGSLLITSAWRIWWGGYSYGPRLLADGTPALVAALAALPLRRAWSALLATLGVVSIAIHLLGALVAVGPLWWDQVYMPRSDSTDNLWSFSRAPIVFYGRLWVRERFALQPAGLAHPEYCRGTISGEFPTKVHRGKSVVGWVMLDNRGNAPWWQLTGNRPYGEMHLTYRWINPDGEASGEPTVRSFLWDDLDPGESIRNAMTVIAPQHAGPWTLRLTMTAEGVRWCDGGPAPLFVDLPVTVR